jgi:alkanesulfonate monooxygenase SsuD/methylene tetrahydromethanopterin reductase-like flavin-dependent oxidoreductase (luciferase family)
MQYAMALPQGGRAAGRDAIRETARVVEELGYSHLWVNDHITSPKGQEGHISPFMFDPMMTAATAAAITSEIGIGIQLVVPYYEPLWLANALASLDVLSAGRVTISAGVGWSKEERRVVRRLLGRGAPTRSSDPATCVDGRLRRDRHPLPVPSVKVLPKPAHPSRSGLGTSEPAYGRAVRLGDASTPAVQDVTTETVADRVARIRRDRPEESFTFSVYTWEWDLSRRDEAEVVAEHDAFAAAGVQHVVVALGDPELASGSRAAPATRFGIEPRWCDR